MHNTVKSATRLLFILLVLGTCFPFNHLGGGYDPNRKVYQSGLMAIRNIVDTQDALKEQLEILEEKERKIKKEKEKFKLVANSFQGVIPNGRRAEDHTRSFLKHLKNLDRCEQTVVVQPKDPSKKKSRTIKGFVIGGLVAAVGIAVGIALGKGFGKKEKECDDGNFARFVTDYIKKRG